VLQPGPCCRCIAQQDRASRRLLQQVVELPWCPPLRIKALSAGWSGSLRTRPPLAPGRVDAGKRSGARAAGSVVVARAGANKRPTLFSPHTDAAPGKIRIGVSGIPAVRRFELDALTGRSSLSSRPSVEQDSHRTEPIDPRILALVLWRRRPQQQVWGRLRT